METDLIGRFGPHSYAAPVKSRLTDMKTALLVCAVVSVLATAPAATAKYNGPYKSTYSDARLVCSFKSVSKIAGDFNLPKNSSADRVARRYARGYFPAGRRNAAYLGCRAGMAKYKKNH
jgi:hypothetical protein